ncbi:MAG: hypothetical protein HC877_16800 [Thioploca sp.]|nr:hypothetical protein [Thioploca sp.]
MAILKLTQLLTKIQLSISMTIKPILKQQQLSSYFEETQILTPEIGDEYVYALLLDNLPPLAQHRK